MAQSKLTSSKEKIKESEIQDKQSQKSSSLISSSRSSSSDSSGSQSKYQKKQLQSSKLTNNDTQQPVKSEKKQKKYSSRSRSQSSKGSRSIKKKQKHRHRDRSRQTSDSFRSRDNKKDKYRTQRYRDDRKSSRYRDDRDRDRDRDRRSKRDQRDNRDNRYNRDGKYDDRRDRRDRGRSREKNRRDNKEKDLKEQPKLLPTQIPMPLEVPMPAIPGQRGQRRQRQRSRSPLSYYRRNQNNNQGEFWDSFSWVPRINYTPNVSSSALVNTKKMRRLMITNIPYEMGIEKEDLRELITRFMTQNYLKDSMNNCPVRDLELNQEDHTAAVELSSVEETCRMCKLEKIELFKGTINGIIRLGDSCYGNNVVTQAQNAAQAQAAAFAAINVLENKKTSFNMDVNLNKGAQVSTLIRVTNAVTTYMAENMTAQEMQDYHEDLIEGFSQYGKVVHNWFVKPSEKDVCANPGDLFIEYESQQEAVNAMNEMQEKFYDQRVIKLYYIPRDIYYPNYKKDLTPPTIKAPPKKKVETPFANLAQLSKSAHIATKAQ